MNIWDPTITITAEDQERRGTLLQALRSGDGNARMRAAVELAEDPHPEVLAALIDQLGLAPEFGVREALTWSVLRNPEAAAPLLQQALRSHEWPARMQAAHVLSKLGRAEDADHLLPLADDFEDAVAHRAWWALAQTGDLRAIPALCAQLGRGDGELRDALTRSLAIFGEQAVPELIIALREAPLAAAREHAADVLAWIGTPGADGAVAPLRDALADHAAPVRLAALNALGRLDPSITAEAIASVLGSDDHQLELLARRLAARS